MSGEPKRRAEEAEDAAEDALATSDESREIIGELSAALAVLAGESLKPCTEPCPGHLGPKATEAMKAALAAWHALQDGNRAAVERVKALENSETRLVAERWQDRAEEAREAAARLQIEVAQLREALGERAAELVAAEGKIDEQASALCAAGLALNQIATANHRGSWPAAVAREALARAPVIVGAAELTQFRLELLTSRRFLLTQAIDFLRGAGSSAEREAWCVGVEKRLALGDEPPEERR